MKTQTQLCMIWCSEAHSLLAKTSSSSPTSCEHRGHYCVRNINIFTLLSPSHHHRHHHHHQVTVNTIISHVTIILSSSAPSPSSRRPQDHHHHHLTSSPLLWHHHHCCDIITTIVTSSPLLRHLRHHLHPLSPSPSPPPSAPPPLSTRFWIPVASRQSLFNWPERTVFLFSSSQKDSHLTDVFLRAVEHPRWPENKENWWSHVLVRQPLSGLKTNRSGLSLLRDFCAVSPPYPHLSCVTVWFLRNQLTEIEDNKVSFCPLRSLQQILVSVWRNWLSWISRGREMFISVTLLFWEKWQARAISGVATLKAKYSCGPMH